MKIRLARESDSRPIQKVIETAFPDEENKMICNLADELAREIVSPSIKSLPPIRPLVAELDHQVIGYICYSPIILKDDIDMFGYILAPLAVSPEHQRQGVGSRLIRSGIDMPTNDGVGVLLVYGDPGYYGRFGFKEETGRLFVPPYPLKYPSGWTAMMLEAIVVLDPPVRFGCVDALSKPEFW